MVNTQPHTHTPLEVDFLFYTLKKRETKSDMMINMEQGRAQKV